MRKRFGKARALAITPLGYAIIEHPCRGVDFTILELGKRAQCQGCGEVIEVAS